MAATSKDNKKLSPYQEELVKAAKQIKEYKMIAEANIVAILYKQPELYFDYSLTLDDFSENTWRVYWQIASDLLAVEQKSVLDDMTVGLYLEKHPKLKNHSQKLRLVNKRTKRQHSTPRKRQINKRIRILQKR